MEEILASIRRIIAEDEAGRARAGAAPMPPRSTDGASRTPRPRNGMPEAPPPQPVTVSTPRAPQAEAGEMVLDLTNMVAADGSVVTIAPGFSPPARSAPPPAPTQGFAPAGEQNTVSYSGFSRRPPPPGPGAEPRTPSYTPAPMPPMPSAPPPSQPMGFSTTPPPDSFSKTPRAPEPMPIPASLSEDSPSRRVFKRRHTAGSAFAELAQTGFAPAPPPAAPEASPASSFGQVSMGSVATELDMSTPPPVAPPSTSRPPSGPPAPPAFAAEPYAPPAFAAQPAPPPPLPAAPTPTPAFAAAPPAPAAPQFTEEQMRAAVGAAAEPVIRSWLDANLAQMIEQQLGTMVQQRVEQSVAATLPQAVDQRIHQNVEQNLGPYIEDRVGAHVDARLAAAVEEKVNAAVKQQVASAVNQQISQAVSKEVAAAVTQQLQGQAQNVTRIVDERVKNEIRGLFSRLAGN